MSGPEPEERVAAIRQLWSDGDYRRVAALFAPLTDALVAELDLDVLDVLDAATGTGNAALAAARAGARVTAFDLTPRLLDFARARAEEAGLDVDWREGDLLDVPFPDDAFDVVLSTFGAFTADDPRCCAAELVRVCRPGGRVVTTAWAAEKIFGELTTVVTRRHPEVIPPDRPDPRAWADPDGLGAIVEGLGVTVRLQRRTAWFAFPSAEAALDELEEVSGPVQRLRQGVAAVQPRGWAGVREELLARWTDLARPAPDGVELPAVWGLSEWRVAKE
jgi:SAM-dependent methyltransferase